MLLTECVYRNQAAEGSRRAPGLLAFDSVTR